MNDLFVIMQWPEVQEWMEEPGFEENSHLINDEKGIDKYGSSAYFISKEWLDTIKRRYDYINEYFVELINNKLVKVPTVDIDDFLSFCEKGHGIIPNGGAFETDNSNVIGQWFYIS